MIKESKHPIARALFVDKSDLAEREKEDLEFVDKLISRESKLFASRYEILSVISSDSHTNDENVNLSNVNNNNANIKNRLTKPHQHHHLNVHKSHKFKHHQRLHHPYNHHNHHYHHHPVVNNIDDSTHLVNDAPGTVTASYLAFILWQILLRSKRSW